MKKLILMTLAACFVSSAAHAAATCREGEEALFDVFNGDFSQRVLFVCRGGEFVQKYNAPTREEPKYLGCREGSIERFSHYNGGETDVWENYVCRNGRFVPMYGTEPAPVKHHASCKDGELETFWEYDSQSGNDQPVQYVCHAGRFVKRLR